MEPIVYKKDELAKMSEREMDEGYIKFNIPDEDEIESMNGEGVWGWASPEDKAKYNDDSFYGIIDAILCNDPFNFYDRLAYGAAVVLRCHGPKRPTLDPDWVRAHLVDDVVNNLKGETENG